MALKPILIVTYYWPPGSGPGVQRWLKMSGFLPEHGYLPTILTVRDGAYPNMDASLLAEVHPDIDVIRTETWEPFALFNKLRGKEKKDISVGLSGMKDSKSLVQRFAIWLRANYFIPDARLGWKRYAIKAAQEVIARKGIELVITSGPPHSSHAIGMTLQSQIGLKWIADLRDPWHNIHYHDIMPMGERARAKHLRMETEVLEKADAVTVVSPGMQREFVDRAQRIEVIYNGYDDRDFVAAADLKKDTLFTLRYIGNLKPNQNVPVLWSLLADLITEDDSFAEHFRLDLVGRKDESIVAEIKQKLPAANVVLTDYVPHHEAARVMQESAMLLFIIPASTKNGSILTGKLFEYLASGTPMLSVGPVAGDAARIIDDCERAPLCDYGDADALKAQVLSAFKNWSVGETTPISGDQYERYSREAMTRDLANICDGILGGVSDTSLRR